MNETEFLDLLRYYFRNAKTDEVNEILSDYESHFEEGKKRGLSEEEIAKELGSPKDIYDSFQSEGVVDEKTKGSQIKETAQKLAQDTAAEAGKAWSQVSPRLPEAAETTARISARLLTAAGIIISVVILAATALVIALLTMNFAPLPWYAAASAVQSPHRGLHYRIWHFHGPLRLFHHRRRQPCHPERPG